jgi:hypothetical protein
MREQLNVKQRQAISETPAKGGGGLVELLLVTWPEGRLSGQATLARLLPSGPGTRRVLFEASFSGLVPIDTLVVIDGPTPD